MQTGVDKTTADLFRQKTAADPQTSSREKQ